MKTQDILRILITTLAFAISGLRLHSAAPPPFVLFHACPQWASARGHQDYYRYSYDRPFAPGDEAPAVWQLRTLVREIPGSVFGIYLFLQNPDGIEQLSAILERYLEAARAVPGARIAPILHIIGDKTLRYEKLERLTTLLL
ncbi:MAG: hypothetical protein LBK99_07025, partial [Opitutaceae bacterium]|nr:hypothetical protein [Opitutaceae bacterium]